MNRAERRAAKKGVGKSKSRKWAADPWVIYRAMASIQPFTAAEQTILTLPVHEALQSVKDGSCSENHWHTLAAVTNICCVMGEKIAPQVVDAAIDAQTAAISILERFKETGKWVATDEEFGSLSVCADVYEQLLALSTPRQMQVAFHETLRRMRRGQIFGVQR